MQNHSFRTKSIIVGFSLCIFTIAAFMLSTIHCLQSVNDYQEGLSNEVEHFFLLERMRAYSHAALMSMMSYRETNNPESADNFQVHISKIYELEKDILSADNPLTREIMGELANLTAQMEDLCGLLRNDIQIGELLARDETPELLADRREIRNHQNQSGDEIEQRLNLLMAKQQSRHVEDWQQTTLFHSYVTRMLIFASVFVCVFNVIVCFVVIRVVSHNVAPSGWEEVFPSGDSQNLRVIADKLQEIVNSLRR